MTKMRACVVGSGPNGLAAAIVLAQAGVQVEVFEAEATVGGGVRTMELTLPGFQNDFGSAVHPMAVGSPFFSALPLEKHGLEWIHSPAAVAHPLDDGTAVVLERELADAERSLGVDGRAWRDLVGPFVEHWWEFAPEILRPPLAVPRHPVLMARFGWDALLSAKSIARQFKSERTRALFAGFAAHSFLALDEALSGALGLIFAITVHAVDWPIPRGGAQALTNALSGYLGSLGGVVKTSARVESLGDLGDYDLILCDVTPRQLLKIGSGKWSEAFRRELGKFRYGPGVFKVDYALSEPVPWKAADCLRAATVHIGGSFEEIAEGEKEVCSGRAAERPYVLLSQPTLFDRSRAPAGKHIVWAYCHVPNGWSGDMTQTIEDQIERFAPGFRECVLARRSFSPAELEAMDANLVGGDVAGGAMDAHQFLFRPTMRGYGTSAKNVYICSASTPPGGGVHGMCGFHAAKVALAEAKASSF
jgi:phytoene dehydrogenase-like protein